MYKRINQLTAKRKQAMEEAGRYQYAQQVQQQNEQRKSLQQLDKGYINEYGTRIEMDNLHKKC